MYLLILKYSYVLLRYLCVDFFLFVNEENGNIKKYYILIVIDKNFLVLNDKYFI